MTGTVRELRVHESVRALVRPFVTAIRRVDSIPVVLVEAVDDSGASGWGEAAVSWRVTGESPASVRAAVLGPLRDAVVGRPLDATVTLGADLARVLFQNSAARSAVECAVQDLSATRRGLTVAEALGSRPPRASGAVTVRTDITVSAASTATLVEVARQHVADGFSMIKVKVGAGGDDRGALVAVREAVGPDVGLRVDANQAWEVDEAVEIIRRWEAAGVDLDLVEQPVRARDLDGLAAVTARVGTPVLADESVRTSDDLHEVIRRRAAGLVNIKLAKTGGLAEARSMAELAARSGIGVVIGCMMESSVGVGAAAALAASLGGADGARTHDLDAGLWQSTPPVRGGIRYDGAEVVLSSRPGLGIDGLAGDDVAEPWVVAP
ncbi:MAG TPA: dipeptide epimerase [Cellulomonadaceae bacterium]|nr:dipeptide epimerase [Cellulomonadaceae bacterium]